MAQHQTLRQRVYYAVVGAILSWLGLGIELFVTVERSLSRGRSLEHALMVFFSFFTILTNLLVAFAFTAVALQSKGSKGSKGSNKTIAGKDRTAPWSLFSRPFILGGIAPSIALVGIVYNLMLRQLWHPTGWGRVADELLHVIVPLGFVIYWFLCVPKAELRWRDCLTWALYPILYLVYALIHGAQSGVYAYPFIDVAAIGYGAVMVNSVGILLGFLIMALFFIAFDRRKE